MLFALREKSDVRFYSYSPSVDKFFSCLELCEFSLISFSKKIVSHR